MSNVDYWEDCILEACDQCKITLTKEQLDIFSSAAESGHEHYDQAYGLDVVRDNYNGEKERENEALRKRLEEEKQKVVCRECRGYGYIITHGPCHSSEFECHKCRGAGRS